MMNKMKKSFVLALGVALCLVFVASAPAFEGASLESQTTFNLFEDDPFDLSIDPGVLYQVDRWRLYTNLSNYENEAGAYYLIGTSGKLGAGSLAFFYETNKYEDIDEDFYDSESGYQNIDPAYWDDPVNNPYVYTGTDDRIYEYDRSWYNKNETENHNLYMAYSIDLGIYSLGLGYAPEFEERTRTLGGTFNYDDDFFASRAYWDAFNNQDFIGTGANTLYNSSSTTYGNTAHTKYYTDTSRESFTGETSIDDETHAFALSSHIHPGGPFEIQATLGYEKIDIEESGTATYTGSYRESQKGEWDGYPAGDFGSGYPYFRAPDGYLETGEVTSVWNGAFTQNNRDGDGWSLELVPSFEVNPTIALEMKIGYGKADGDISGNYTQTVNATHTERADASADTETAKGYEFYDNTYAGDWEQTDYYVEPRVYLTYGPVEFRLGVGYSQEKYESDSHRKQNAKSEFTFDDGDGVDTAADWTADAGYTGYYNTSDDAEETAWSFPVATRFKVTDKLTLRAGACYTRTNFEENESSSEVRRENEHMTVTDGTGEVVAVGPASEETTGGVISAYDRDTYKYRSAGNDESTVDTTDYSLGLGYQVTEHLAFDLMFKGEQNNRGGVDTETIWASVTLAF